jgi:hypothetical protein
MEQRRVRLGDIVDDYCPRERRVTNHAVVAMIEDEIRQTRCTACDADHPYKAARIPRSRRKDALSAGGALVVPQAGEAEAEASWQAAAEVAGPEREEVGALPAEPRIDAPPAAATAEAGEQETGREPEPMQDGPVHRPLIRAQLPRPEGQATVRPLPEFTMRQSGVRGGRLIDGDARGNARGTRPGGNGRPPQHARHSHRPGGHGPGHGRPHGTHPGGSRFDRPHGHGGHLQRPAHSSRGKKRSR